MVGGCAAAGVRVIDTGGGSSGALSRLVRPSLGLIRPRLGGWFFGSPLDLSPARESELLTF